MADAADIGNAFGQGPAAYAQPNQQQAFPSGGNIFSEIPAQRPDEDVGRTPIVPKGNATVQPLSQGVPYTVESIPVPMLPGAHYRRFTGGRA